MPMLKMVMVMVMMLMTMGVMMGRCEEGGQDCTMGDLQAVQPDIDVNMEQMDGRWVVNKAYGHPAASGYLWYTIDVVPTPAGMAFFTSFRASADTCVYHASEVNVTENSYVYIAGEEEAYESMVVAAADGAVGQALWYWCQSTLRSATDPCLHPMVLAVGRQHAPEAAEQWLASLTTSSLPCYNDTESLTVPEGQECSLSQMVPVPGRDCNVSNFPVQENFNVTEYVSRPWKELAWMPPPNLPPSDMFQSYVHTYTLLPGDFMLGDVSARNPQDDNKCFFLQVIFELTDTPGKVIYHDPYAGPIHYDVIDVDYDHYALVFGCLTKDDVSGMCTSGRGVLWSRDVTLERRYRLRANALLLDLCVNPAAWFSTVHVQPCPACKPCSTCKDCPKCTGAGSSLPISPTTVTVLLTLAFFAA